MALRLVRIDEVARMSGTGKTQAFHDIRSGLLPPPIKRGRMSLFPEHEIDAVNAARIRGADDEGIRALVKRLLTERESLTV